MNADDRELPMDRAAAWKHTRAVTLTFSLVACLCAGAGLILLIWAFLNRARMRRWCDEIRVVLSGSELIIRQPGIFSAITCIPLRNIGHIAIRQGPYLRKYGICNIEISGLGPATHNRASHIIPAVPEGKAEEVVALIRSRMERTMAAGCGHPDSGT